MSTTTAADIALALFMVFSVLGFGWRTWVQHRRTGSSGFYGVSGSFGSPEWIGGVCFVLALLAAVSAPILQHFDVVAPVGILQVIWIQIAGILIATTGIVCTVGAQLAMGDSWRIGVDEGESTELVHTGIFGLVRNPIYTAMFIFSFGILLVTPNGVGVAAFFLLVAAIQLQVRRVEEPHLLRVHGDAYRDYTSSVGRFIPGVGRR